MPVGTIPISLASQVSRSPKPDGQQRQRHHQPLRWHAALQEERPSLRHQILVETLMPRLARDSESGLLVNGYFPPPAVNPVEQPGNPLKSALSAVASWIRMLSPAPRLSRSSAPWRSSFLETPFYLRMDSHSYDRCFIGFSRASTGAVRGAVYARTSHPRNNRCQCLCRQRCIESCSRCPSAFPSRCNQPRTAAKSRRVAFERGY